MPLLNDYEVAKNLSRAPHPYTEDDACAFITWAAYAWRKRQDLAFAILRALFLVADVDEEVAESREDDNAASRALKVDGLLPDLVSASVSSCRLRTHDCNQGDCAVAAFSALVRGLGAGSSRTQSSGRHRARSTPTDRARDPVDFAIA